MNFVKNSRRVKIKHTFLLTYGDKICYILYVKRQTIKDLDLKGDIINES